MRSEARIPARVTLDYQLHHAAFRLYAFLAMKADQWGRCTLKQIEIADALGVSRPWVTNRMGELVKRHYVRLTRVGHENRIQIVRLIGREAN